MDSGGKSVRVKSIVTETKAGLGQEPTDGAIATWQWLPSGEVAVFTYLRDRKSLAGGPSLGAAMRWGVAKNRCGRLRVARTLKGSDGHGSTLLTKK